MKSPAEQLDDLFTAMLEPDGEKWYVAPVVFDDGSTGYGVFRPADRRHTDVKGGRPLNPFTSTSLADCAAWIDLNNRGMIK